MSPSSALKSPNPDSTFCGVSLGQAYQDFALWEEFLTRYPAGALLELGTWRGGMALFFAIQCRMRSMRFATVDRADCDPNAAKLVRELGGELHVTDLFSVEGEALVGRLTKELPKPLILFCDDGNKADEYKRFAPLLVLGDFVAVHDWGSEFGDHNRNPHLPLIMATECEQMSSITRFFHVCSLTG